TINHSWSGGALTVLSQYLCGVSPLQPGYTLFQIKPQTGNIKNASAIVPSVAGEIKTSFINKKTTLVVHAVVPSTTSAIIVLTQAYKKIKLNGKVAWKNGKYLDESFPIEKSQTGHLKFKINAGNWKLVAIKKREA